MAGSQYSPINNSTDRVTSTQKVTAGYFDGGVGTIGGTTNLVTASLSTTQKNYYYNLQYSSKDHFSVAYGHSGGSGSDYDEKTQNHFGETKAIYKYFADLLLDPVNRAEGDSIEEGYFFSQSVNYNGGENVDGINDHIYVLSFERARMKDRVNKKNWTLQLSGSNVSLIGTAIGGTQATSSILYLTDDSEYLEGVQTGAGIRYNIVSGSSGVQHTSASQATYGWFYPDMGIMVFDANQLSASLPGSASFVTAGAGSVASGNGLAPDLTNTGTADNAWKFARAFMMGTQTFRNEEDQNTVSYFCRAFATQFNSSNNPSYTSGSQNRVRNLKFWGNPQTYITTVGLYSAAGGTAAPELVATGRLSSPVLKNNQTEVTIKVNLTF